MSPNKLKLIVATLVIVVMVILLLAFPGRSNPAEIRNILDRASSDTAAAKAAADSAAESAARAKASARDAQNRLPGSS